MFGESVFDTKQIMSNDNMIAGGNTRRKGSGLEIVRDQYQTLPDDMLLGEASRLFDQNVDNVDILRLGIDGTVLPASIWPSL